MCRIVKNLDAKDEVYGVLTDYDLSSWAASLKTNYTKTSQQRTGTPPYMAQELLMGRSDTHLYRHDVESLFYIMLLTCARHEFDRSNKSKWSVVMREGKLPYQKWFSGQDYDTLGRLKGFFLLHKEPIELSPAFEDFRPWLQDLRISSKEGFMAKLSDPAEEEQSGWRQKRAGGSVVRVKPAPDPFDDETLGGYIDYWAIVEPARTLGGELTGLDVRYDPQSPPLPTPTDVVHVDV